MTEQIFKFNGEFLDYDRFVEEVMNSLEVYKFADANTIALAKKANTKEVSNAIKDGVIRYVKENPNVQIKEVCKTLKVKSIIIAELADEGRLLVDGKEVEQMAIEMMQEEKEASKRNKILCLQEQNNALKQPIKTEEVKPKKEGTVFHTKFNRR